MYSSQTIGIKETTYPNPFLNSDTRNHPDCSLGAALPAAASDVTVQTLTEEVQYGYKIYLFCRNIFFTLQRGG